MKFFAQGHRQVSKSGWCRLEAPMSGLSNGKPSGLKGSGTLPVRSLSVVLWGESCPSHRQVTEAGSLYSGGLPVLQRPLIG